MRPKEIRRIACLGAGVIGTGWATYFLMKGYSVRIYDIDSASIERSQQRIKANLDFLKAKKVLNPKEYDRAFELAFYTTDLGEAVGDVQFIQESGPENYEIKQKTLQEAEKYTEADTIFASSTSGLLITEIARYARHPERCLGAHPYNPPHLIPLIEMSKGELTSDEVLKSAYNFYKMLGKEPIILNKEVLGFVANRLQAALYREAVDLVMKGVCSVEDVDKACCFGPGLRYGIMGPNLIFHLGGGEAGIKGMMENLVGPSLNLWLKDMAKWEEMPSDWPEVAQEGVLQEMERRPAEAGRNSKEILEYRDDMLISLLKLHKKL